MIIFYFSRLENQMSRIIDELDYSSDESDNFEEPVYIDSNVKYQEPVYIDPNVKYEETFGIMDKWMLYEIVKYLPPKEVLRNCRINKKFANICGDQSIFRRLMVDHFPDYDIQYNNPKQTYINIVNGEYPFLMLIDTANSSNFCFSNENNLRQFIFNTIAIYLLNTGTYNDFSKQTIGNNKKYFKSLKSITIKKYDRANRAKLEKYFRDLELILRTLTVKELVELLHFSDKYVLFIKGVDYSDEHSIKINPQSMNDDDDEMLNTIWARIVLRFNSTVDEYEVISDEEIIVDYEDDEY